MPEIGLRSGGNFAARVLAAKCCRGNAANAQRQCTQRLPHDSPLFIAIISAQCYTTDRRLVKRCGLGWLINYDSKADFGPTKINAAFFLQRWFFALCQLIFFQVCGTNAGPSGSSRTPARKCLYGYCRASTRCAPGATATSTVSAIGSKSARK